MRALSRQMSSQPGNVLYISWKFDSRDGSARRVSDKLAHGERLHFYRLRSWVVLDGEARVLLDPAAPLAHISQVVAQKDASAVDSRWIGDALEFAEMAREIETAPVTLGLTERPEQWPLSSAAFD